MKVFFTHKGPGYLIELGEGTGDKVMECFVRIQAGIFFNGLYWVSRKVFQDACDAFYAAHLVKK
jgi:hypothetical protein